MSLLDDKRSTVYYYATHAANEGVAGDFSLYGGCPKYTMHFSPGLENETTSMRGVTHQLRTFATNL